MEKVWAYGSLEKAEAAGEMLIRYGMSPKLDGTTLLVAAEDAEKAKTLLGIADEEEEKQRTEPFHPCPKCSTADPIWFGKRKILLLVAVMTTSLVVGRLVSAAFWALLAVAFIILLVGFYTIPEYECRRCGHRWTREPQREA